MNRSTVAAGTVLLASITSAFVWIGTLNIDDDGSLYRWTSAKTALDALGNAIAMSARERGRLPTEAEGLDSLVGGDHPFLGEVPRDPWLNPYVYRPTKKPPGFEIHSIGRNGREEFGGGDDIVQGAKTYRCEDYTVGCTFTSKRAAGVSVLLLIVSSSCVLMCRGALALARIRSRALGLRSRARRRTS